MKKLQFLLITIIGILVLNSYCFASGAAESDDGRAGSGAILRVAAAGEPGNIDPVFGGSPVTTSLVMAVYETPVGYAAEERGDYSIQTADDVEGWKPLLAQKVEISGDRRSITFHLRRGVKFYPSGNEMNADDWIWAWQRQLSDPPLGWARFENFQAGITSIDQIVKVDDYTIRIELNEPNPLALAFMRFQMFAVYDSREAKAHATADDPWAAKWLSLNTAGTGPYYIDEWVAGEKIVLKANPFYWGDSPDFKTVVIDIVPEESTRLALLARGDVMLVKDSAPELAKSFGEKEGINLLSIPSGNRVYIGFDSTSEPFSDKALREAVAFAVPFDSIVDDVYEGCGRRFRSFVHPQLPSYTEDGFDYETDLQKAGRLIAGISTPQAAPVLQVNAGSALELQIAALVQDNLSRAGLDIEIEALPPGEFTSKLYSKELDFFITSGVSWIDDPATIAGLWMASGAYGNYTGFSNAEVDEIQAQWQFALPSPERNDAYRRAQRLYNEEVNSIYLLLADNLVLLSEGVSNYTYYKDTATRYQDLKISE